MQPQHQKKKVPKTQVTDGRAPMTVAGQRYVPPAGRHSQQTHRIAAARAAAAGNTEQEQHAADRDAAKTALTDQATEQARHKERSKRK